MGQRRKQGECEEKTRSSVLLPPNGSARYVTPKAVRVRSSEEIVSIRRRQQERAAAAAAVAAAAATLTNLF